MQLFTNREIRRIFNIYLISENSLYSMKEIKEEQIIKCTVYRGGRIEYSLHFHPYKNERLIGKNDMQRDPLERNFIKSVIKDILHTNPNLEFCKGFFINRKNLHHIQTSISSIKIFNGFSINYIELNKGNYLNISLKNQIIQDETILEYLNRINYIETLKSKKH